MKEALVLRICRALARRLPAAAEEWRRRGRQSRQSAAGGRLSRAGGAAAVGEGSLPLSSRNLEHNSWNQQPPMGSHACLDDVKGVVQDGADAGGHKAGAGRLCGGQNLAIALLQEKTGGGRGQDRGVAGVQQSGEGAQAKQCHEARGAAACGRAASQPNTLALSLKAISWLMRLLTCLSKKMRPTHPPARPTTHNASTASQAASRPLPRARSSPAHMLVKEDAVAHRLPPEQRHLVAALADGGGGGAAPQLHHALLPRHGHRGVHRALQAGGKGGGRGRGRDARSALSATRSACQQDSCRRRLCAPPLDAAPMCATSRQLSPRCQVPAGEARSAPGT